MEVEHTEAQEDDVVGASEIDKWKLWMPDAQQYAVKKGCVFPPPVQGTGPLGAVTLGDVEAAFKKKMPKGGTAADEGGGADGAGSNDAVGDGAGGNDGAVGGGGGKGGKGGKVPPKTPAKTTDDNPFFEILETGAMVSAQYMADPAAGRWDCRWYPGIVFSKNVDGTYHIVYKDGSGDEQKDVPRCIAQPSLIYLNLN